ncbi:unnamed protein product [Dibothriocephalus latus]|uniref:Uncharacterized protein n=1 Tax=Dibothriocephalus latus TaxID=60516 RepID=A0A3P7MAM6_DIBLA|nr:unnamed protein product [Dibothriocephalus latus]
MTLSHFGYLAVFLAALSHEETFRIAGGTPFDEHGIMDCAVKNHPVNKKPPSEMQPVNAAANAGNTRPPSEMLPVNPPTNTGSAKHPSKIQPVNPPANAGNAKPPSVMQPFNQAANAGYNRLPSKDQITSTATYAFSLVPTLLVSAWLFAEMQLC